MGDIARISFDGLCWAQVTNPSPFKMLLPTFQDPLFRICGLQPARKSPLGIVERLQSSGRKGNP